MAKWDYDLITIGAGSGGVRASRTAASLGAKVAIVESSLLGGTCVNVGCIPKKFLSYAAHYHEDFEDARGYGWTSGQVRFDWRTLIAAKDAEIARLNDVYERILVESGVAVIRGTARVVGVHEVQVGENTLRAKHILLATGGRPVRPPIPGSEHMITSNEAFHLDALPERVVVYGGGYIGVEFASIFNGLGANTTLVCRAPTVLRGFDEDIGPRLVEAMTKKGIRVRTGTRIERIAPGFTIHLSDGSTIEADCILAATGRWPNSDHLGLEPIGVVTGRRGEVVVDENYTTNIASIHAIGDVTDRIQLTPVALAEGMAFAQRFFGDGKRSVSYEFVPTAVFTHPTYACVGLTEQQAKARGYLVRIFKSTFTPLKHRLTHRAEQVFMKLVVDANTDRVLGAHMLGSDASEIIPGFAAALTCGATKAQLDATIGIHPTVAEEFLTMREASPV